MKTFLLIFAAAFAFCVSPLCGQETDFEVVVSGELAAKLEPNTFLSFSTIGTRKEYPYVSVATTIENLPFHLPSNYFQGRTVYARFQSPSLKKCIFSMRLSSDLFDKPRRINLKLDAPKPSLRPTPLNGDIKYSANITKRMAYELMPYWDSKLQKLTPLPKPLVMRLAKPKGEVIETVQLGERCMGATWFAAFKKDIKLPIGTTLEYSVLYNSGGLFAPIDTKLQIKSGCELRAD